MKKGKHTKYTFQINYHWTTESRLTSGWPIRYKTKQVYLDILLCTHQTSAKVSGSHLFLKQFRNVKWKTEEFFLKKFPSLREHLKFLSYQQYWVCWFHKINLSSYQSELSTKSYYNWSLINMQCLRRVTTIFRNLIPRECSFSNKDVSKSRNVSIKCIRINFMTLRSTNISPIHWVQE